MKKIVLVNMLILVLLIVGCTTPTPEAVTPNIQAEQAVDEYLESLEEAQEEIPIIEETEKEVDILDKVEIEIKNWRFYPDEIMISPGTTVTWINNDIVPHKVVAYDRVFYGNRLSPGDSYSFIFTNEGTHRYFDAVFPKRGKGEIIVKEEQGNKKKVVLMAKKEQLSEQEEQVPGFLNSKEIAEEKQGMGLVINWFRKFTYYSDNKTLL